MLDIGLDAETERGLQALARSSRRSKSAIARDAIRQHVAKNETLRLWLDL
jgi:predicted transcriptional regulator